MMKKLLSVILALCMVCLMGAALAENAATGVVGMWYLKTVQNGTMNVDASTVGMVITLEVKEDASFTMDAMGTVTNGTWELKDNTLALTAEGTTIEATYADETLTMAQGENQMIFTKEEQKALTLAPVKENAAEEEFEGNWTSAYASVGGAIVNADVSKETMATLKIEKGQMSIAGDGSLGKLTGGLQLPMTYENGKLTYTMSAGTMSVVYTAVMLEDGMLGLTADIGSTALTIYFTKTAE